MNLIMSASIGIIMLILAFAIRVFFRKRNYIAVALVIPYLIFTIVGLGLMLKTFSGREKRMVKLSDMQLLQNAGINDFAAISFNSNVTFGDGYTCAGGIICQHHDNSNLAHILRNNGLIRGKNMALVWLLDYRASKVLIENDLLFFSDQQEAAKGIWIGWIDEKEVEGIKKLDGGSL